jgi:S-adenosylmethionine-diacylgycerolhomoserine-N-methlytransferase
VKLDQLDAREQEHRRFLDRYYGWSRHVYDATRRYYLLGRDRALELLLEEDWDRLVEIGPGTGRNLRILHRERPSAKLGGIEASTEMLRHGRSRCPFARIEPGFAESADLTAILGARPDRILFSYSLSMIEAPERALSNAMEALAPGGSILIVDFGALNGLPSPLRAPCERWLSTFHVRTGGVLAGLPNAARYEVGPLGVYEIARIERPLDQDCAA